MMDIPIFILGVISGVITYQIIKFLATALVERLRARRRSNGTQKQKGT